MIPKELKKILAQKGYPTSTSIARATGRSDTLVHFMLHGIRPCPKLRREVKFITGINLDDYIPRRPWRTNTPVCPPKTRTAA